MPVFWNCDTPNCALSIHKYIFSHEYQSAFIEFHRWSELLIIMFPKILCKYFLKRAVQILWALSYCHLSWCLDARMPFFYSFRHFNKTSCNCNLEFRTNKWIIFRIYLNTGDFLYHDIYHTIKKSWYTGIPIKLYILN